MIPNIIYTDRPDRIKLFCKELWRQKIEDFELWQGETSFDNPKRNISESHKKIVRDAKEKGLSEVLIFENDVWFPAIDGFEYFLNNKPKYFDIYFGGIYSPCRGFKEGLNKITQFSGLHCYIVHSRFYDTFLSMDENENLDYALNRKGEYYLIYPFAAIQHETPSDNQKGMIYQNKQMFKDYKVRGFNC